MKKQREVLASDVHLVEIDLIRGGQHVVAVPEWVVRAEREYDYLVSVNRGVGIRDECEFYPRTVRERLPRLRIPLAVGDPDVRVDLNAVVARTYRAGQYARELEYNKPCVPPLQPADQAWADELIRRGSPMPADQE